MIEESIFTHIIVWLRTNQIRAIFSFFSDDYNRNELKDKNEIKDNNWTYKSNFKSFNHWSNNWGSWTTFTYSRAKIIKNIILKYLLHKCDLSCQRQQRLSLWRYRPCYSTYFSKTNKILLSKYSFLKIEYFIFITILFFISLGPFFYVPNIIVYFMYYVSIDSVSGGIILILIKHYKISILN